MATAAHRAFGRGKRLGLKMFSVLSAFVMSFELV
jgi:hypothetical protein